MPSQFEKYRFTKKTVLSDETFNRIFKDLDLRITALEDIKKDWEYVVRTTTQHALTRINEVLAPSWEYIQNKNNEADELVAQIQQKRDNADAIINANRDAVLQEIQSIRAQVLQDIEQVRQQAVSQLDLNKLYAISFFFGGE